MRENVQTALSALQLLFGAEFGRAVAVRLWDGTSVGDGQARFRLSVATPGTLRLALAPPFDLSAGRAFAAGMLECEGDVESAVDALLRASARITVVRAVKLALLLRRLPREAFPPLRESHLKGREHSRARDRAAIGFHYDLPIDFYRSFLDRNLVYSCAYYDEGVTTLDDAQDAKIDYVLRKLRVQAGERLLDIGCGWGALVVRAAERWGAQVLGVTLSQTQYDEARRRIANAGLQGRARVELRDYRELGNERFEKIVSIGMVEHVGRTRLREYFRSAWRALQPGGLFLNHGIADESPARRGSRSQGFMKHFVFPDGDLVAIGDMVRVGERAGFEVRDVENLREHYARTLRAWVANLEANRLRAIDSAGEAAYRVWRLYLAGSAQGFRSGRIGLYQTLFARPDVNGTVAIPPTRRDLYA